MQGRSWIALILCAAVPLVWAQSDEAEGNRRAVESLKARLAKDPKDATLLYFLAAFQARVGDSADAVASLVQLKDIGTGFLPTRIMGFDVLADDPAYKAAYAALEAKLPRMADAPIAFELADTRLIPEGIAFDPVSKSFFLGSIPGKRIVRITIDGKVAPFSRDSDGLRHVLGLAVDSRRGLLHAISTNALTEAGRANPFNSVVSWDLRSGRKVAETRVTAARQLNDVAVAPNGDLYLSDSASGAIWHVRDGSVKAFLPAGNARGTNGVAVSDDGEQIYAATTTGLIRLHAKQQVLERMPPPPGESVAAIDGLYFYKGDLLGIQNVTNPARVIRIKLGADGKEITAVETLQSHHNPAFDEPTTGVVAGEGFYVLATTQVGRFNDKGDLLQPETLKRPKVIRIPLKR